MELKDRRKGNLGSQRCSSSTDDLRTANIEEMPGTIHFLDYPDPTYTTATTNGKSMALSKNEPPKTPVNTRLVLHLTDRRIPPLMTSIAYRFVS